MFERTVLPWPVASFLLLLPCSGVHAQQASERQVRGYLAQASDMLLDPDYRRDDVYAGFLGDGEEEDVWLTLRGGADYSIVGVCDEGCADLDLFLYDQFDDEVDADAAPDDLPLVQGRTDDLGEYRVRVRMYSCDSPPCQYAFGVYRNDGVRGVAAARRGGGALANEVRRAVRRVYDEILADHGFEPTGASFTGVLRQADSDDRWVRLQRGFSYAIVGVCDEDCRDLDLVLYDDQANEIDADLAVDTSPMVQVRPLRTGDYRIGIRMYRCSSDPCYYDVSVYRR